MSKKISERAQQILETFEFSGRYQMSAIAGLPEAQGISLATLKRDLNSLAEAGYIKKIGTTSNLRYSLTDFGLIHRTFNGTEYIKKSENERRAVKTYNFRILDILSQEDIFTEEEMHVVHAATDSFRKKGNDKSTTIQTKELERFIIELSWKSSKIEGNTYTLLDTEKLIREGVEAVGHNKDEAIMILNHKKAFSYILECKKIGKDIISFLELQNIHRLLVEGLGVTQGLRKSAVGITGTSYLPLSHPAQIEEETRKLLQVLAEKNEPFSASLLSILGMSYLQPFEDGNKRTARLFSNGILLQSDLAPLSYRSVDEREYREAILLFYEQNSIEAFKKIFIDQYVFSSENYNVS